MGEHEIAQNIISLPAKSSSGESHYTVQFIVENGSMKVKCNCQAGKYGRFCKHKFGLLKGNEYWMDDESDDTTYENMGKIRDLVQKSEYLEYIIKGSKLQDVLNEAEKDMKEFRKRLAAAMKKGLPCG